MARFSYKDRLTVVVHEMNRAAALRVAQTINTLVDIETDSAGFMSNEVHLAFVLNAPCMVTYDKSVLTDGTHHLAIDDSVIELTLPLTRETFEALPVSLTAAWIEAAELENEWLSQHFLAVLNRIVPIESARASDSAAS